ncbi:NADH dehydrogenase [ubiquinone] 1 alpha subcomplex subunit 5 [Cylas formicarius]|uniref:NADH dehydrogenase [ubiquinone] 1 alpha subcomplex subunit 5 n=1 Tax=Cylas formicarius TaxID=197179 RepID=UPI002958D76A|nr:NADH dehydrogenase [ubiquinone] 1 alpha subcomplex subunit 5 [Cylas formicarius]XP_060536645.1 NADH dehydrogenase [ubiquinone] 1 alpha subcomplex subunit 5 [Cylas formicarius]
MSGIFKKSTGLTGLIVAKNPHQTLSVLYGKILRTLQKMPESAAYRKNTELIIKERSNILQSTSAVEEVEKKINCGQIEEVIVQAENELILARKMLTWRPWEPLVNRAPSSQWTWPPAQRIEQH